MHFYPICKIPPDIFGRGLGGLILTDLHVLPIKVNGHVWVATDVGINPKGSNYYRQVCENYRDGKANQMDTAARLCNCHLK